MLIITRIAFLLISLTIFSCLETPRNNVEKPETTFPLDTTNITDISLSAFFAAKDSVWRENRFTFNKTDYLNIIAKINSSKKVLDPKVDLNVVIVILYSDNRRLEITANNKYFTLNNKVFYSWCDTIFVNNNIDKLIKMKQCVK